MSELYFGIESAVRCGGAISDLFMVLLEFVRGVYFPHTFQRLYGLDSGEDVGEIKLRCIVWEWQDL